MRNIPRNAILSRLEDERLEKLESAKRTTQKSADSDNGKIEDITVKELK